MRRRSTLVVFVAGILAGVAGAGGLVRAMYTTTAAAPGGAAATEDDDPAPAGAAPSVPSNPPVPDLRETMRASVAAALAEQRRGRELEIFLDELEAHARRQGKVTAVEVQTGMAALDAAYPDDPDKSGAFARRMEDLSRALDPAPGAPTPPPSSTSVLAQLQAIESTPPGPARDRLTPGVLAQISQLPIDEQDDALRGLDRATSRGRAPEPEQPVEE